MFLIGAAVQSTGLPPSFYGSLIGSFFLGSVAVGILVYNNWQKNKEFNYRCYGTMKVINIHLASLLTVENITLKTLKEMIDSDTEDKTKKLLDLLTQSRDFFVKSHTFLEKERANIPYDFTSRYFTITSSINNVIFRYDELMKEPWNPNKFEPLIGNLNECDKLLKAFNKNTAKYLKNVEKKYKIRDFY
ncbi:hypothetical protein [Peribacillus muralis]|uniref:hypothetical protein n=1 Tax=Peribacillus muralis TaxID=264697 RepID=UPI000708A533|nr:hypothetical protein [Peribacillus muralis]